MIEIVKDVFIIIATPVVRSAFGWAVHAFEDRKITPFELRQLGATITRVGLLAFLGYVGFNIAGVDNAALSAGVAAIVGDKILSALKKNKNVR